MTENNSNEFEDIPGELDTLGAQKPVGPDKEPTSQLPKENSPDISNYDHLYKPSKQDTYYNQQQYDQQAYTNMFVASPSFGQTLALLPGHCIKALSQPATSTFVSLKRYANWNLVWLLLILSSLFSALSYAVLPPDSKTLATLPIQLNLPTMFLLILIFTFVGYFISNGLQYFVARRFFPTQTGTLVEQFYTTLLPTLPVGIIELVVSFFPSFSAPVFFVLSMYTIILNVMAIRAVYSLSSLKATLIYFIPLLVLFGFLFVCALCSTVVAHH